MFGISAFSESPFSDLESPYRLGSGTVNGVSSVTVSPTRIMFSSADITCDGATVIISLVDALASASVNCSVSLSSNAFVEFTFSGTCTGTATVTADGSKIASGNATITCNGATVVVTTVDALTSASITCTTTVSAGANIVAVGSATAEADAFTSANTQLIVNSTNATVSSTTALTAIGYILGEEWTDAAVGSDIWYRKG